MSIRAIRCFVVTCDACRRELDYPDEGYVPHFDSADQATDVALQLHWQLDADGRTYCQRCVAIAVCLTDGHDMTVWMPCVCQGSHPDHALWGCGLLRYCQLPGCDHAEAATLASLPTTDDPYPSGR